MQSPSIFRNPDIKKNFTLAGLPLFGLRYRHDSLQNFMFIHLSGRLFATHPANISKTFTI